MIDFIIIIVAKYFFLIILGAAVIFFFKQTTEIKKNIFFYACLALPLSYLSAKTLSHFFFDPRPFVSGHFTPLISHVTDNGFPSDHALLSFTVSALIFMFNKKIGLQLALIGFVIGVARIIAGVHSPIDIFGSFLISVLVVALVSFAFRQYQKIHA